MQHKGLQNIIFHLRFLRHAHINSQRKTGFLKGSRCALLSKRKPSTREEAGCSFASELSITKSMGGGRTSCSSRDCNKDSEQNILHSSSGSVEEYLADTEAVGKADVANSTTSTDLLVNQAHDVPHGCISSKENLVNLANDPEAKDSETGAAASHTFLETTGEGLLGGVFGNHRQSDIWVFEQERIRLG